MRLNFHELVVEDYSKEDTIYYRHAQQGGSVLKVEFPKEENEGISVSLQTYEDGRTPKWVRLSYSNTAYLANVAIMDLEKLTYHRERTIINGKEEMERIRRKYIQLNKDIKPTESISEDINSQDNSTELETEIFEDINFGRLAMISTDMENYVTYQDIGEDIVYEVLLTEKEDKVNYCINYRTDSELWFKMKNKEFIEYLTFKANKELAETKFCNNVFRDNYEGPYDYSHDFEFEEDMEEYDLQKRLFKAFNPLKLVYLDGPREGEITYEDQGYAVKYKLQIENGKLTGKIYYAFDDDKETYEGEVLYDEIKNVVSRVALRDMNLTNKKNDKLSGIAQG